MGNEVGLMLRVSINALEMGNEMRLRVTELKVSIIIIIIFFSQCVKDFEN